MSLSKWGSAETLWWWTVLALLALLVVTFALSLGDRRLIDGVGIWAKPMKFQLSLAVHFATLALIVSALSQEWRMGSLLVVVAAASVASTAFEIAYIMIQAARGQTSHFNLTTPFHTAMYVLMASGAVIIVLAATAVGGVAMIDQSAQLSAIERAAVVIGLLGGSLLTLYVAFKMGGRMSHTVGGDGQPAQHMLVTGWLLNAGDLRVPHFFATHMIQAIPAFGFLAARRLPASIGLIAVIVFASGWSLLTLVTFQQALAGKPITALLAP